MVDWLCESYAVNTRMDSIGKHNKIDTLVGRIIHGLLDVLVLQLRPMALTSTSDSILLSSSIAKSQ